MTIRNFLLFFMIFAEFFFVKNALAAECSVSFAKSTMLNIESCSKLDGLEKVVFSTGASSSPYATAFDTRKIVVLKADINKNFIEAAGFVKTKNAIIFKKTMIAIIPEEDQIFSRKANVKISKKGDWTIGYENIKYASQGGVSGFPIICATALSENNSQSIAVSECFALEEKTRFIDTLGSITY